MAFLARWGEAGRWHLANTIFEGFIGMTHLLMPDKIYNGARRRLHYDDVVSQILIFTLPALSRRATKARSGCLANSSAR